MYFKFFKRFLDFLFSLSALIAFSPLLLVLAVVGAVKMKGNPFFFQLRPGKNERIFKLIKFRTMTSATDDNGKPLPDEKRLTKYGRFLRTTSLDELPELFNILAGQMTIVGPRPQLVRDMVFMTDAQRRRHSVRPGLTGLAQINGRNAISWEEKLEWDQKYIDEGISVLSDALIVLKTVKKVFKRSDTIREGTVSDLDFGDWLLQTGKIDSQRYDMKQLEAREIMRKSEENKV